MPRIAPARVAELTPEAADMLQQWSGGGPPLNIFLTYLRHPAFARRWAPFAAHVFVKSTLPRRERELVILRTAWRSRSPYEFAHHARLARAGLLDPEEIARITDETLVAWRDADRLLLEAVDELVSDHGIGDETWAQLHAEHSDELLMDLVFTVGAYTINSMAANSFGIELESGMRVPAWS